MEWAQQVESLMDKQYFDVKREKEQLKADTQKWGDAIIVAVNESAERPENDGLVNIAGINPTGTAGVSSWKGSLDAEDIEQDILPAFKTKLLRNPLYVLKAKDLPKDPDNVGATLAEYMDVLYGAGAFAKYWKEYGGVITQMRYQKSLNEED